MQANPHQLRASHAFEAAAIVKAKDNEGEAVAGFPALILRSGLLATLAFALEKNDKGIPKRDAHARITHAIAVHLAASPVGEILGINTQCTGEILYQKLMAGDSALLRRCTAESLEYLSYLKRFAR